MPKMPKSSMMERVGPKKTPTFTNAASNPLKGKKAAAKTAKPAVKKPTKKTGSACGKGATIPRPLKLPRT